MMAPPTGFTDDSMCNTSLMIKAKVLKLIIYKVHS